MPKFINLPWIAKSQTLKAMNMNSPHLRDRHFSATLVAFQDATDIFVHRLSPQAYQCQSGREQKPSCRQASGSSFGASVAFLFSFLRSVECSV